jgi:hypothetical protein
MGRQSLAGLLPFSATSKLLHVMISRRASLTAGNAILGRPVRPPNILMLWHTPGVFHLKSTWSSSARALRAPQLPLR